MRVRMSVVAAAATAALAPLLLPSAVMADSSPQQRVLELRDQCEATSFNAQFGPGFCTTDGSVSADEFLEELTDGGHGAWWIRQRDITLKKGDTIAAKNVGGIAHTFTEVAEFGIGCVPPFNVAVKETVNNCDFSRLGPTLVAQGRTSAPETLAVGVHRFQCLFHPWMRTTVTVRKR